MPSPSPRLLAVAGLAALLLAPLWLKVFSTYDGGIAASAGTFTLKGLLPYRDYWLLYGPLAGWVVALPTLLLGPSVELVRALGFATFVAATVASYRLVERWASPPLALVVAIGAVIPTAVFAGLELGAWPLAMVFALASIDASARGSHRLSGVLAGLAFATRFDVGGYLLLALLLGRHRKAILQGFAGPAVAVAVMALATTSVPSLIEQLVWYPLVGPREFRGVPGLQADLPTAAADVLQVPLVVVPRLAIVLAAARFLATRPRDATTLQLVVFALLCQLQTLGRADEVHLAQAAIPGTLLIATLAALPRSLPRVATAGALATPPVLAACLAVGPALFVPERGFDRAVVLVADLVRRSTAPSEPIFVGLTDHRYTVVNPLLVYYLADRPPGVTTTMFNPGITNTTQRQLAMEAELESRGVRFLVLSRLYAQHSEPTNATRAPGASDLDGYIRARYRTVCELDALVVMERRFVARSDGPPVPSCAALSRLGG